MRKTGLRVPFTKMHGCGNDCVILDARDAALSLSGLMIRRIADRHRGVGCDQVVVIRRSEAADARLIFYNGDGERAQACGNATRCSGLWLRDQGATSSMLFESDGGFLTVEVTDPGAIRVEMPTPRLKWHEIPLATASDTLAVPLDHPSLGEPVAVNMGNPHLVYFVEDVDILPVGELGAALERHPILPERGNIGFASIRPDGAIRLRVFERGAGLTLACGSGACAALVAAVRRGLVDERAAMILDGGKLEVSWPGEGPVIMTGPAEYAFEGRLLLDPLEGTR